MMVRPSLFCLPSSEDSCFTVIEGFYCVAELAGVSWCVWLTLRRKFVRRVVWTNWDTSESRVQEGTWGGGLLNLGFKGMQIVDGFEVWGIWRVGIGSRFGRRRHFLFFFGKNVLRIEFLREALIREKGILVEYWAGIVSYLQAFARYSLPSFQADRKRTIFINEVNKAD